MKPIQQFKAYIMDLAIAFVAGMKQQEAGIKQLEFQTMPLFGV